MIPFRPAGGSTVNIDVAATTANVLISAGTGMQQVRVCNNGSATAWIRFGTDNTVVATTSNIPIPPGAIEILSHQGPVYAAAIAAGSTGKVYFTPGEGI